MAQALVSLDKDDETLVINTKISDRVWLQSPSTTTFSNDDKNLTKMLALYAKRDNDDESLTFIFEKAWKIFLLSRKTENLPEQVATEVEHALNTTNNIATGLLYAFLGPHGANLINMSKINDPDRFGEGPMSRLIPLAAIHTFLGQGMEDQVPEDIIDQVITTLATLADNLLHPTHITGLCITNHFEKIMTESTITAKNKYSTLGDVINKTLKMSINWNSLSSPNNCAYTWCGDPLPNNDAEL